MKPKMSSLISRLRRMMPLSQAVIESKYIMKELPQREWIKAANRRSGHEPLQYILGGQPFGRLDIACRSGVLIPRHDTESWVMKLAECLQGSGSINVIDYCTGSGCVGLGLLSELGGIKSLTAFDISEMAINLAQENYERNCSLYESPLAKVDIRMGDLLQRQFDVGTLHREDINLLVSNPPYIPEKHMNEAHGVEKSVLDYEPHLALVGDMEFYDALCDVVLANEAINGFVFELGYMHQAEGVMERIVAQGGNGWKLGVRHDDMERIRCVIGWKTPLLESLAQFKDEGLDL